MNENALILFVRNPLLGKVKTRLAKDIGNENALAIYKELLMHTHHVSINTSCDKYIFYEDFINTNDIWENENYKKYLQHGNSLGERMKNAFEILFFNNHKRVVIIGSDCIELTAEILEKSFEKLKHNDVVIGPAKDGGYYLLGMNYLVSEAFTEKNWSTPEVLQKTISDINKINVHHYLLEELSDVDNIADITPFLKKCLK